MTVSKCDLLKQCTVFEKWPRFDKICYEFKFSDSTVIVGTTHTYVNGTEEQCPASRERSGQYLA